MRPPYEKMFLQQDDTPDTPPQTDAERLESIRDRLRWFTEPTETAQEWDSDEIHFNIFRNGSSWQAELASKFGDYKEWDQDSFFWAFWKALHLWFDEFVVRKHEALRDRRTFMSQGDQDAMWLLEKLDQVCSDFIEDCGSPEELFTPPKTNPQFQEWLTNGVRDPNASVVFDSVVMPYRPD